MINFFCENYINRWNEFPDCIYELLKNIFDNEDIEFTDTNPDIIFLAPFNNEIKHKNIPLCYIIHENLSFRCYDDINLLIKKYKIPIIGYVNDGINSCEYPHWLYKYNDIISDNKYKQNKIRENKVCSVIRNHNPQDRENILKFYNSVNLNNDGVWGTNSKFELIYKYYYNISVENSYKDCYITEKIYDSVISGCIPIYKGGDLSRTILNEDRIIKAYDKLPENPEEMFNLPILKPNNIVEEMYYTRKQKLKEFIYKILNVR